MIKKFLLYAIEIFLIFIFTYNFVTVVLKKDFVIFNTGIYISNDDSANLIFATKKDEYVVNETIVYKKADILMIRDIAQIENEQIIKTKAKNNIDNDSWSISKEDILGEYQFEIKKAGKIFKIFQNIFLLTILGCVIITLHRKIKKI